MDQESWNKAQALFAEALELEPARREAFLDESCGGDASLKQTVLQMLRADAEAEPFLERMIGAGALEVARETRKRVRVGPYILKHRIGEGGMSTVHLAIRDDESFQRRVALKLIKRGMDTEDILRRFRVERQILAGLDHPNIARLIDGGSTEDGRPYFILEYIEGERIDLYCDRLRLTVAERLALFCRICSAVHYAHQNLIVHRDIKPDNILVTQEGVPKLLDFGIAKLLNPDLTARTIDVTEYGRAVMTPEYASPEQFQGRPITTATDIYSLGVLLSLLLSGQLPYRLEDREPRTIERAISEIDPVRPSEAAAGALPIVQMEGGGPATIARIAEARSETADRLRRRLSGDLDNIVLMALRKDPRRRYASALQFAEDIDRHLQGRPVLARKDTLGYRTAKFVRRNRVMVGGVALITAFAFAMTIQSIRVGRQRDLVGTERDKVAQVSRLLLNLFEFSDPTKTRGESITAREILDAGARRLGSEPDVQPEVRAQLLGTIGNVYSSLGLYESARPLLEEALELRRATLDGTDGDLAQSLNDLGALLGIQGDYQGARRLLEESLAIRRAHGRDDPLALATAENELGSVSLLQGDAETAETLFQSALERRREHLGADHVDVAQCLHNIGRLYYWQGKPEAAIPIYRQALEVRRRLLSPADLLIARTANNLGMALYATGDLEGARVLMEEVYRIQSAVFGPNHPQVASSLGNLAELHTAMGYADEAEPMAESVLEIKEAALGPNHADVAKAWCSLAAIYASQGRTPEAETAYRKALSILRHALPVGHPDRADPLLKLGLLLLERHEYREACTLLQENYELEHGLDPESGLTANAACALGAAYAGAGRFAAAESLLVRSWSRLVPDDGSSPAAADRALGWIIELYRATGRADRVSEFERARLDLASARQTRP